MRSAILLLTLCLSACSFTSNHVDSPVIHTTQEFREMEIPAISAEELPVMPKASVITADNRQMAAFDLEGMNTLQVMRNKANKNTEMLKSMIDMNTSLVRERNELVALSQELEARSNTMAEKWAKTEEDRRNEKDKHFIERTAYQIGLATTVVLFLLFGM